MSDTTIRRQSGLASLWPWPGNLFLLLFAGWLIYMGSIAELEDVRTAFYGLGGVTVLLLLLGLRYMARRPRRVVVSTERPTVTAEPVQRRNPIGERFRKGAEVFPPATAAAVAAEPAPERRAREAVPVSEPRMERRGEPVAAEPEDARFVPASNKLKPTEVADSLRHLESWLNRERAERGAQIAKIEGTLSEQLATLQKRLKTENTAVAHKEAISSLHERIEALSKRVEEAPIVATGGGGVTDRAAVEAIIEERVAAALEPETLRKALAGGEGAGEDQSLLARFVTLQQALEANDEATRAERAALREDLDKARKTSLQALNTARTAKTMIGELDEKQSVVDELDELRDIVDAQRAEISGLRDAMAAGGIAVADVENSGTQKQLGDLERAVAELRGNLDAVAKHVSTMGDHYQGLLASIERLGASLEAGPAEAPSAPPAETGGVHAEVEALRDALTTIIEQNREIRQQQEMLSARFDAPTRIGVDPSR